MIEVTLIDHMGSDLSVVNAARVSFGKKSEVFSESDKRLIKYLAKHEHYSPFGHCFASFHVKAPIFVARQLVKHKFLRWNEVSRRYVDDEPEFYYPVWRKKAEDKKQGSGSEFSESDQHHLNGGDDHNMISTNYYRWLLDEGVAPEQARMVLPQSVMTEWYWSGSLDAFANMYNLRSKIDTQAETRQVAYGVGNDLQLKFPISWMELTK